MSETRQSIEVWTLLLLLLLWVVSWAQSTSQLVDAHTCWLQWRFLTIEFLNFNKWSPTTHINDNNNQTIDERKLPEGLKEREGESLRLVISRNLLLLIQLLLLLAARLAQFKSSLQVEFSTCWTTFKLTCFLKPMIYCGDKLICAHFTHLPAVGKIYSSSSRELRVAFLRQRTAIKRKETFLHLFLSYSCPSASWNKLWFVQVEAGQVRVK